MGHFGRSLRQYSIVISFLGLFIVLSLLSDNFLTPVNLLNTLESGSIYGIVAVALTLLLIVGEFDLSVGAIYVLSGIIAAKLFPFLGSWPALALGAMSGLAVGLFNGFLVTKLRIPAFIVGLGGMLAFRGVLLGVTHSSTITPVPDDLVYLAQGLIPIGVSRVLGLLIFIALVGLTVMRRRRAAKLELKQLPIWADALKLVVVGLVILGFLRMLNDAGGVPVPVMILLALLAVFSYIATQTVFGRHIYAVGGNMEATRLSGVNVGRVKLAVFATMGLMAAFAGIITTARLASGSPSAGTSGELDAIAACFIGGTSMRGGSGTVHGALIGALVMASLDNGMSMMDVDAFWQMIVKGGILVLAVWVDVLSGSNRG
jgi:D-xylose transport system permease protein